MWIKYPSNAQYDKNQKRFYALRKSFPELKVFCENGLLENFNAHEQGNLEKACASSWSLLIQIFYLGKDELKKESIQIAVIRFLNKLSEEMIGLDVAHLLSDYVAEPITAFFIFGNRDSRKELMPILWKAFSKKWIHIKPKDLDKAYMDKQFDEIMEVLK